MNMLFSLHFLYHQKGVDHGKMAVDCIVPLRRCGTGISLARSK